MASETRWIQAPLPGMEDYVPELYDLHVDAENPQEPHEELDVEFERVSE